MQDGGGVGGGSSPHRLPLFFILHVSMLLKRW